MYEEDLLTYGKIYDKLVVKDDVAVDVFDKIDFETSSVLLKKARYGLMHLWFTRWV